MSVSINGSLVLLLLLVPVGLTLSLLTAPRWMVRSMSKHALWRLRDEAVADARAGLLPADHPATKELLARVEWAIGEARSFDLLHLWVWVRATRNLPNETRREVRKVPDLASLSADQTARLSAYRARYNSVAIRAVFLSSWIGIALVIRYGVPVAITMIKRPRPESLIFAAIRGSTDKLAAETKIGQSARDFVTIEGPGPKMARA